MFLCIMQGAYICVYNQEVPQGVEYQHEFYIHASSYHYEEIYSCTYLIYICKPVKWLDYSKMSQ